MAVFGWNRGTLGGYADDGDGELDGISERVGGYRGPQLFPVFGAPTYGVMSEPKLPYVDPRSQAHIPDIVQMHRRMFSQSASNQFARPMARRRVQWQGKLPTEAYPVQPRLTLGAMAEKQRVSIEQVFNANPFVRVRALGAAGMLGAVGCNIRGAWNADVVWGLQVEAAPVSLGGKGNNAAGARWVTWMRAALEAFGYNVTSSGPSWNTNDPGNNDGTSLKAYLRASDPSLAGASDSQVYAKWAPGSWPTKALLFKIQSDLRSGAVFGPAGESLWGYNSADGKWYEGSTGTAPCNGCLVDANCGPNQKCVNGQCQTVAATDPCQGVTCGPDEECVNGKCQPKPNLPACSDTKPCPDGKYCIGGDCLEPPFAKPATGCPSDLFTYIDPQTKAAKCVRACPNGYKPDANKVCQKVVTTAGDGGGGLLVLGLAALAGLAAIYIGKGA